MADVAVLGAGSWGTALAVLLAKKGFKVNLWGRNSEQIDSLNRARENLHYLPGVVIPHGVTATSDLGESIDSAKYIVLSVPSHSIRELCRKIVGLIEEETVIINTAKGLETDSLKRLSQVIEEELSVKKPHIAVLSGPSHAEEVGRDIPTAVVAGAHKRQVAEEVQDLFMSPKFRVYTNPDLIGIELGGALKNVIALGTGIADGLGFGDNTKAALITRGVAEMARLGVAAGANPLTFAGLTGIGDLVVTCTSMHSRNRRAGIQIGQGIPLEEVLANMGMVVEGVKATAAAFALSKKYGVPMPITTETYHVLFENKKPKEAVVDLMLRMKTHEVEEVVTNLKW
ncbi:NAD(P)H-dependent glycerol-3-phosphate dehydrogenase [Thermanaerosceptrum fracticalcis]|uniref:Glycerol-3-phosphate dehydrogenase [NAD(P)+] n=1 Tax=Thermanaerosceptrum fracticalcis TaxID=1712410 RepID=A0A7G6E1E8_THEFR|nr:NAD(P)H-dependent glycerol-3-phosphate dehydrogenase [Thermanaerosceptrum fracticalcis]QNB45902.1 NAD(P)H-dependent glycerol-3-phosphate dehydrogenase [Thermanaerosceptrum fracticalcis]